MDRIVVVGGSIAGLAAAETLRESGYRGKLSIIGAEQHLPYERPPLSKQYLLGVSKEEDLYVRGASIFSELSIDACFGVAASGLDCARRTVSLSDGRSVEFDGLIIATGVSARVPGFASGIDGILTLRTLTDAEKLRQGLQREKRVIVVGAGFLGTEIAASAAKLGCQVTLVDLCRRPLEMQLGPVVSSSILELHQRWGTEFIGGSAISHIVVENGRPSGIVLDSGRECNADIVVLTVGSTPATQWACGSGLKLDQGVVCDQYCSAGEGIYACGDVARWFNPRFGKMMRIEHRVNAAEQGAVAARNLLGDRVVFDPIPYFWTDQFDTKVQVYGVTGPAAETYISSRDAAKNKFSAVYVSSGLVQAVMSWNSPRELARLRDLIGHEPPPDVLRSPLAEPEMVVRSPRVQI